MQIEYSQEKELDDALDRVLHSDPNFVPLIDNLKIGACFCIRTDDKEATVAGKGEPVVLKKVPADMQTFMRPKNHFVLVVDYHFWENAMPDRKNALMFRALTRIKMEKTDAGLKVGTRPWDIQDNLAMLKKFGPYNDAHVMLAEIFRDKMLSAARGAVERKTAKPVPDEPEAPAANKSESKTPGTVNKEKSPAENSSADDDEPRRPARRIPPDPVVAAAPEEVEPED